MEGSLTSSLISSSSLFCGVNSIGKVSTDCDLKTNSNLRLFHARRVLFVNTASLISSRHNHFSIPPYLTINNSIPLLFTYSFQPFVEHLSPLVDPPHHWSTPLSDLLKCIPFHIPCDCCKKKTIKRPSLSAVIKETIALLKLHCRRELTGATQRDR